MRRKIFQAGILGRLIIALILALWLVPISSNSVAAQSPQEYFKITHKVELSESQVTGSEIFYATIEAEVNCTNDLWFSPSEAEITNRIIATHQTSGANVTLNSEYILTIKPFPSKEGENITVNKVVSLYFPEGSQSGTYDVIGEITGARVKVLIWLPVTNFIPLSSLPPPQTIGSITYVPSSAPGGGDGEGGRTTKVNLDGLTSQTMLKVDENGIVQETSQLETPDEKVSLAIAQGTKLLDAQGEYLDSLSASETTVPPESSSQRVIVYAYDFGPGGAIFDPAITLTIAYDESLIPESVAEENLVMAMWDEAIGEWAVLAGSSVDLENNTVTAPVGHFTTFAVLAYTGPAIFDASELSITPVAVDTGERVTISALITNTGDVAGSYKVTLKIDSRVAATEEVTLEGGASEEVTFTIAKDVAGSYAVAVEGLTGTFTVRMPPRPINWWLPGGIIAALVALGVVISLTVIRRRRA